eukprot:185463-Pelagomonas_calceolata.AAC.1
MPCEKESACLKLHAWCVYVRIEWRRKNELKNLNCTSCQCSYLGCELLLPNSGEKGCEAPAPCAPAPAPASAFGVGTGGEG